MDSQLIERAGSMLSARVERAAQCPDRMFPNACGHLLAWLSEHPLLGPQVAVLDEIDKKAKFDELLRSRFSLNGLAGTWEKKSPIPTATWEEQAALGLAALRLIAGKNPVEHNDQIRMVSFAISGHIASDLERAVSDLRHVAVASLHAYLEESVDGQFAVVSLLKKYKQRSEWYRRARLRTIAGDRFEGQPAGEDSLMMDLYEYVHDQGVDLRIESWSASGRADLVADSVEGQRLVLDGKYVRRRHGAAAVRALVAQGLRQVFDYCRDHGETRGYLVTYVGQDLDVQIEGASGRYLAVEVGNVIVCCVFVNIFEYEQTASERPQPKVMLLRRAELRTAVEAAKPGEVIAEEA